MGSSGRWRTNAWSGHESVLGDAEPPYDDGPMRAADVSMIFPSFERSRFCPKLRPCTAYVPYINLLHVLDLDLSNGFLRAPNFTFMCSSKYTAYSNI